MNRANYGHNFGMKCFYLLLRYSGIYTAYLLLSFVILFYALRPGIQKSAHFYLKKRFENDNLISRYIRTIKYIFQFGLVLVDQAAVGVLGKDIISVDFPKTNELFNLSKEDKGLIILSSHIGTWKMVMAHMGYLGKTINFLLNINAKDKNQYFFDISGDKTKYNLIDPTLYMGGMIEAANALENKECMTINGDRTMQWRTGSSNFFGEKAKFPIIAQHLAYSTNSYLVMILTARTGRLSYSIEYINLTNLLPKDEKLLKNDIIQLYLDLYSENLENFLKKYPYMWFNFFDFWYKDMDESNSGENMKLNDELKRIIIDGLKLIDVKPEDIDENEPLFGSGLGLDSLDAVELVVLLKRHFKVEIKDMEKAKTAFSSIASLSEYIRENYVKSNS